MRGAHRITAGLALLLICACAPRDDAPPPPAVLESSTPTPTGPTTLVRVGDAPEIRAEIAATPAERGLGLMNRPTLPDGTGMLFVFAGPSGSSFYMWQTLVPLSIAFVDVDRVVSVAEMAPCRATTPAECERYSADGPYTLAIEAPGGWFTDAGVEAGDPVTFDPPPPAASS